MFCGGFYFCELRLIGMEDYGRNLVLDEAQGGCERTFLLRY